MSSSGTPGPHQAATPKSGADVGRMTAIMRALAAKPAAKVLRVAVVIEGRIVDERIMRPRKSVTVGTSRSATFRISGNGVPSLFRLFEFVDERYVINFVDGMTGRLSSSGEIADLDAIKPWARREGEVYQVNLLDKSRGRIVIGSATVLFQFVPRPVVQQRPTLPRELRSSFGMQVDWDLTLLAAISFLFHFGTIGVSARWDPEVSDEVPVRLLEIAKASVPPPAVETKLEEPKSEAIPEPETKVTSNRKAVRPTADTQKQNSTPRPPSDAKQISDLVSEADAITRGIVGVLGPGPANAEVLRDGSGVPIDLTGIANKGTSVETEKKNGLHFGKGSGPIQPGQDVGLQGLPVPTGTVLSDPLPPAKPLLPKFDVTPIIDPAPGNCPEAEVTIRRLAPRARSCYQKVVSVNPAAAGQGNVRLIMKVGPSGEVANVSESHSGVSPDVAKCIANAARNLTFACKPGEGGLTVSTSFKLYLPPQ